MISQDSLVERLKHLRRPHFIIYEPQYSAVLELRVIFFSLQGKNLRDLISEIKETSLQITNEINSLAQEILAGFIEVKIDNHIWLSHSNVTANLAGIGTEIPYPDKHFLFYGTFINDYLIELRAFCRFLLGIPVKRLEYWSALYNTKIKKTEQRNVERTIEQFVDEHSVDLFILMLKGNYGGPNQINWIGEPQELCYLMSRLTGEKIIDFKYQHQYKFMENYFFLKGEKIKEGLLKSSSIKRIDQERRQKLNAVVNNILLLIPPHSSRIL